MGISDVTYGPGGGGGRGGGGGGGGAMSSCQSLSRWGNGNNCQIMLQCALG